MNHEVFTRVILEEGGEKGVAVQNAAMLSFHIESGGCEIRLSNGTAIAVAVSEGKVVISFHGEEPDDELLIVESRDKTFVITGDNTPSR